MEYERIHKVEQMGVISPSKLRMKLLGVNSSRKKEGGSNSKLEDTAEYAKNHLLSSDIDEQDHCSVVDLKPAVDQLSSTHLPIKEKTEMRRSKSQNISRAVPQSGGNLSSVHPVRPLEEDGNGSDSGSTSTFEFHRGDQRSLHSAGSFARHVPSKWNDAEKWIVGRQSVHPNVLKNNVLHSHVSRLSSNWTRNAPEMIPDTKRIDSEKFSFVPRCLQPNLVSANEKADFPRVMGDSGSHQKGEDQNTPVSATQNIQSVSTRDVGTEMTPIPSQEPSRTGTPMGATTPRQSPKCSMPSSPKKEAVALSLAKVHDNYHQKTGSKQELYSDMELKLKTRREIAALGMKLGKMNIASWASKETEAPRYFNVEHNIVKEQYEERASAWEESEKAKHMARYKQEEAKIQAWENHQKAKIEAKMRKLEVLLERKRARSQEKMARKLAETRRQVEERLANAEVRRNQKASRTTHHVKQIRQTGRIPSSHIRCCSLFQ